MKVLKYVIQIQFPEDDRPDYFTLGPKLRQMCAQPSLYQARRYDTREAAEKDLPDARYYEQNFNGKISIELVDVTEIYDTMISNLEKRIAILKDEYK